MLPEFGFLYRPILRGDSLDFSRLRSLCGESGAYLARQYFCPFNWNLDHRSMLVLFYKRDIFFAIDDSYCIHDLIGSKIKIIMSNR